MINQTSLNKLYIPFPLALALISHRTSYLAVTFKWQWNTQNICCCFIYLQQNKEGTLYIVGNIFILASCCSEKCTTHTYSNPCSGFPENKERTVAKTCSLGMRTRSIHINWSPTSLWRRRQSAFVKSSFCKWKSAGKCSWGSSIGCIFFLPLLKCFLIWGISCYYPNLSPVQTSCV